MKARIISKFAAGAAAAAMTLTQIPALGAWAYDTESYDNCFTFTDSSVTAENEDGSGFKISGTDLTINAAGTYVVSGDCVEGTITIKKGTEGVVLILDDLNLRSSTSSPLTVKSGAEATIVIEGENTLTDAEDPANEDSEDAEVADAFEGAAIKVKSSSAVTITGTGTLTADGSDCKNGIKGGTSAVITVGESSDDSFTLNVDAANNALSSDGGVIINGGNVNLNSEGDGLKASPDDDDEESVGTVTINGGDISITSGEDAVQADDGFTMNGGSLTAVTAGGYENNSAIEAADISAKGIKSDKQITINGGVIDIDAADDAIHLNGTEGGETISITGGDLTLKSGDDGIHSDYILDIDGGNIDIQQSYEGLEGAVINLKSGSGKVYATDDGVNAANSDLASYDFAINISGGTWYINAQGDGLDSNGDINVSGGYTEVFGSAQGDNAALDYGDFGSSFNVTGGTVIGIGNSTMATTPTSGSYIVFGSNGGMMGGPGGGFGGEGERPEMPENGEGFGERPEMPEDGEGFGERPEMPEDGEGGFGGREDMNGGMGGSQFEINEGSLIEIKDSEGNVLYSGTGVRAANHIVFSSEALVEGETYYLYIDGAAAASTAIGEQSTAIGENAPEAPEQNGAEATESEDSNDSQESTVESTADNNTSTTDTTGTASNNTTAAAATTTAASGSTTNPSTGSTAETAAKTSAIGLSSLAAMIFFGRRLKKDK